MSSSNIEISNPNSMQLETEEVVWVKFDSSPWWPAYIMSITPIGKRNKIYTVFFFGEQSTAQMSKKDIKRYYEGYILGFKGALTENKIIVAMQSAQESLKNNGVDISIYKQMRQQYLQTMKDSNIQIQFDSQLNIKRKKSSSSHSKKSSQPKDKSETIVRRTESASKPKTQGRHIQKKQTTLTLQQIFNNKLGLNSNNGSNKKSTSGSLPQAPSKYLFSESSLQSYKSAFAPVSQFDPSLELPNQTHLPMSPNRLEVPRSVSFPEDMHQEMSPFYRKSQNQNMFPYITCQQSLPRPSNEQLFWATHRLCANATNFFNGTEWQTVHDKNHIENQNSSSNESNKQLVATKFRINLSHLPKFPSAQLKLINENDSLVQQNNQPSSIKPIQPIEQEKHQFQVPPFENNRIFTDPANFILIPDSSSERRMMQAELTPRMPKDSSMIQEQNESPVSGIVAIRLQKRRKRQEKALVQRKTTQQQARNKRAAARDENQNKEQVMQALSFYNNLQQQLKNIEQAKIDHILDFNALERVLGNDHSIIEYLYSHEINKNNVLQLDKYKEVKRALKMSGKKCREIARSMTIARKYIKKSNDLNLQTKYREGLFEQKLRLNREAEKSIKKVDVIDLMEDSLPQISHSPKNENLEASQMKPESSQELPQVGQQGIEVEAPQGGQTEEKPIPEVNDVFEPASPITLREKKSTIKKLRVYARRCVNDSTRQILLNLQKIMFHLKKLTRYFQSSYTSLFDEMIRAFMRNERRRQSRARSQS